MKKASTTNINRRFLGFSKALLCLCIIGLNTSFLSAQCGFAVKLEVTNLSIDASLYNFNPQSAASLETASWYIQSTGQVLGDGAELQYTFSDYGECKLCVAYEADMGNGNTCNAAICQELVLDAYSSICIDPMLITAGEPCDVTIAPVCACNGTTYINACEAEYWAGATSFSPGTCQVDCSLADCVRPGDTNKDLKADLLDVLNLGMAYGKKGPKRPYATSDFSTQAAPDWLYTSNNGTNYKHFDTNGDGLINHADLEPIISIANYSPMHMPAGDLQTEEGPLLHVVFSTDTINIDGSTPDQFEVNANIMLGESDMPIEDFYGIALYLSYPVDLVAHADVKYSNGSFAGTSDEMMWYRKNMENEAQLDVALTRMNRVGKSGFGRVASLNFIVESDIIDGRSEKYVDFPISIKGVKVVNNQGEVIPTRVSETPASLTFSVLTTNTSEAALASKIDVFPNPVADVLNIDLGDLNAENLKLYNSLGQLVLARNITERQESLDLSQLAQGVYMLNILTEKGLATKRVVIEK